MVCQDWIAGALCVARLILSDTYGVSINAATFHYFKEPGGSELLARLFLIEPEQVEMHSRTAPGSKRRVNLSYEELTSMAEQNGVGAMYRRALAGLALLPPQRIPWTYSSASEGGPDWEGFQGFFANIAEVDRLLDGLEARQRRAA